LRIPGNSVAVGLNSHCHRRFAVIFFACITVFLVGVCENRAQLTVDNFRSASLKALDISESADKKTSNNENVLSIARPPITNYTERTFRRPQSVPPPISLSLPDDDPTLPSEDGRFHWRSAFIQTGVVLAIQHSVRMTQPKTTDRLGGKFFKDWGDSIKGIRGWKDGDSGLTNYVGHPMQGSATGRIFVNNSDTARKQVFGFSKAYWVSRLKAMAWSAAWSLQFEIGPISEASIGNVGSFEKNGHSTGAYVDLVVTPTVGTGLLIAEDAVDKYILRNWIERRAGGRMTTSVKILRSFLTPTTAFSNLIRWKLPWYRDTRNN
jgi:hypothetical protein